MTYKLQNNRRTILLMNKFILFFVIFFFYPLSLPAKENQDFFTNGKKNFDLKKLEISKIYFEKDLVRNPKNYKSYLYLAKIYKIKQKNFEYEKNLNTVLLIRPKNEEALYLLIKKKIKDGDYDLAKNKLDIFNSFCIKMCNKKSELLKLINKFKTWWVL